MGGLGRHAIKVERGYHGYYKTFSPETKKLVSIHMDAEMMAYIEENDIDLDLFGDA